MAIESGSSGPRRGDDGSTSRPPTWRLVPGQATSRGGWKQRPTLFMGADVLTDRFVRPYLEAIAGFQPLILDPHEQRVLKAHMVRLSLIEPFFLAHPTAKTLAEIEQFLLDHPAPTAALDPSLGDMGLKRGPILRGLVTSLRHHELAEYAHWVDQAQRAPDASAVGYALETLIAHRSSQVVAYAAIVIKIKALDLMPGTFAESFLDALLNLESYMAKRLVLPPVPAIMTRQCDASHRANPLDDFRKLVYDFEDILSMVAYTDDKILSHPPGSIQADIDCAMSYQREFMTLAESVRPRYVARAAALELFRPDEPRSDRLPLKFETLAQSLISIAEASEDSPRLRERCIELARRCAEQVPSDSRAFAETAHVFQKANVAMGAGLPTPSGTQAVRLSDTGDIAVGPLGAPQAHDERPQLWPAVQPSPTTAPLSPIVFPKQAQPPVAGRASPNFKFSIPFAVPTPPSSTPPTSTGPSAAPSPEKKQKARAKRGPSPKTSSAPARVQYADEESIAGALKRSLSGLVGLEELVQNFAFDVHDFLSGERSVGRLFWGGPGVGKTDFAQRLAGQKAGYPALSLGSGDVAYLSGVDGAIEMRDCVDKLSPKSILFIDEADKRFDPRAEMVSARDATQIRHALITHFQRKPIMYILIGTFAHLPRPLDDALMAEAFGQELASRLDYVDWHFPNWTVTSLLKAINLVKKLEYDDDAALCFAEYCVKRGGIRMFEDLERQILRHRRRNDLDRTAPVSLAAANETLLPRGGS